MLDPYAIKLMPKESQIRTNDCIYEIHKRTVKDRDDFGELTDLVLAHEGTPVLNQYGAPVYKTDNMYVRHLFDVVVHGVDGPFTHKKGDLFINSKGRAQEKPTELPLEKTVYNSAPPKIVFDGIRDGQQSISMSRHHDALREERSVKGIARNLKHYKDRELMKLFDKVNTEIIKRGLKAIGGYQPIMDSDDNEKLVPLYPPQGL